MPPGGPRPLQLPSLGQPQQLLRVQERLPARQRLSLLDRYRLPDVRACARGADGQVLEVLGAEAGALPEAKVFLWLEGLKGVQERGAGVGRGGFLWTSGVRFGLRLAPG